VYAGASELRGQVIPGDCAVGIRGGAVSVLSALQDGCPEGRCAICSIAGEVGVDGVTTCAFAEDGDFCGIAAKGVNIALDPVESEALIEEGKVALC
jgi:hypothetical protein